MNAWKISALSSSIGIDACYNLTSLQRECFSLRLEYGMTYQQIADRLDINKGTVFTHVEAATT